MVLHTQTQTHRAANQDKTEDKLNSPYLDNRRDELLHKVVAQEVGPEVVNKVDQQAFDVGPVLILICHDHHPPIAQCAQLLCTVILLLEMESQDLDDVVDLCIVHDLKIRSRLRNVTFYRNTSRDAFGKLAEAFIY